MKEPKENMIPCLDIRDKNNRRDGLARSAMYEGLYLRTDGDTVVLTNHNRYTFTVGGEKAEVDIDEPLPPEAFREIARKMME